MESCFQNRLQIDCKTGRKQEARVIKNSSLEKRSSSTYRNIGQ